MEESHREGVAIHPDPESCMVPREGAIEALTGAQAGGVLSCENIATGVPTLCNEAEGHTRGRDTASVRVTPRSLRPQARLDTPRTRTGRPHQRPPRHPRWAGRRRP